MKNLIIVLVLVVAGIVALGVYRGWFRFSSSGDDNKANVNMQVDKDKVEADKDKVVDKVQDLGHTAEAKVAPATRKARD